MDQKPRLGSKGNPKVRYAMESYNQWLSDSSKNVRNDKGMRKDNVDTLDLLIYLLLVCIEKPNLDSKARAEWITMIKYGTESSNPQLWVHPRTLETINKWEKVNVVTLDLLIKLCIKIRNWILGEGRMNSKDGTYNRKLWITALRSI